MNINYQTYPKTGEIYRNGKKFFSVDLEEISKRFHSMRALSSVAFDKLVAELLETYVCMFDAMDDLRKAGDRIPYNPILIQMFNMSLEGLENKILELSGVEPHHSLHTFWYRIPQCRCSVMENNMLVGDNKRLVDSGCVFHNLPKSDKVH